MFRRIEPRLHIADFTRSVAFYRDTLGFTLVSMFPDADPSFALLERDGVGLQIGGTDATRAAGAPSTCTLYFDLADVRALHASLVGKIAIEWGPEVFFYQRREFAVRDPDGNLLIFSEDTNDPVTARE